MGYPAISTSARDRRAAARTATSLRGKVFPGAIECVVADFNRLGARVRFEGPPPPGGRFFLVVWSSGVAYEAEPRWRASDEIGVRFVSSRDLRRPAPPHLEEAQALWMKRRPKVGRRQLVKSEVILLPRMRRRHLELVPPRRTP
jgi:hypothetical protein